MSIVLDLIVIAIILIFALISAKKGFVNVVVEVAGIIAAIILTFTISTPLASITYDKIIEPPIINAVSKEAVSNTEDTVQTVWEALPDFITRNAERLNLNSEQLTETVTDDMSGSAQAAVQSASQNMIKPVAVKISGLIYSVILMVVLLIAVKFLARIINRLFSFSIVGKANRTLGGIVGLLKGAVFAIVFCMIISLAVSFTENGFLIFTPENINNSYIFKFLTEIIPF